MRAAVRGPTRYWRVAGYGGRRSSPLSNEGPFPPSIKIDDRPIRQSDDVYRDSDREPLPRWRATVRGGFCRTSFRGFVGYGAGQHITKSEIERLGDPQSGSGDEPEQHHKGLPPQRIGF